MIQPIGSGSPRQTMRALVVVAVSIGAAWLIWRLRPDAATSTAPPDADIVTACTWLAWALTGYLAIATAFSGLAHVVNAIGLAGDSLARLAPERLRRVVDLAVTLSIAATVLGASGAAPAVASARQHLGSGAQPSPATTGTLDWPGLAAPARVGSTRNVPRHHQTTLGLVAGGRASTTSRPPSTAEVVVTSGDSLWSIAARHLGPGASAEETVSAWHQWYDANRLVVGDDPDLIYPGQRLRAPAHRAAPAEAGAR
jgi:hypothetical protein